MKYILFFLLLVGPAACQKKCDESDDWCAIELHPNMPPAEPVDTVNNITLVTSTRTGWAPGNYFQELQFNMLGGVYTSSSGYGLNIADYWEGLQQIDTAKFDTARHFYLKYVGDLPLLSSPRFSLSHQYASYAVDSSLYGKPLFEAHLIKDNSLFQTFFLTANGSVKIWFKNPDYDSLGNPFVV